MSILDKLKKNSTIKDTASLMDSRVYGKKDMITTRVPMINVALSASTTGGLTPGLTVLAGPSKHFKTAFSLLLASAFLAKHPDGAILFYDSEFGTPQSYFDSFGIDKDQVIHTPITDVEQLKFDVMQQLDGLDRDDKVCIIIDSIGNLASKKEVEDALAGKSVADMSRAKAMKSLFRMVTPHLTLKDIPMVVVNHTYKEMSLFPRDVVSGGTGVMYSADNVWIIGRQQDKDNKGHKGYHFIINVEKSRYVREKSKIPITVNFDGGINKYSGLIEVAAEGQYVSQTKHGQSKAWLKVDRETGEEVGDKVLDKDIATAKDFWEDILNNTDFPEYVKERYKIGGSVMLDDEEETV